MDVPRQADPLGTGRVNQKRRTRTAIVEAARELLAEGATPTVTSAAERAAVSRTTAYRYFPTQESLLVEVAVNVDVDDVEALAAAPVTAAESGARVRAVATALNRHVLEEEGQYRTMLRVYMDMWTESVGRGETDPVVREGRRRRWFAHALEPWRGQVSDDELDRLIDALCLVAGAEAVVALRDVAHLSADAAAETTDWVARTLIDATLGGR